MGVAGLLRLVQQYTEPRTVSHYSNQVLGVDAYSWLHRASVCCAEELVRGEFPTRLVQSIDNRVRVYERSNVQLYFVFDGAPLKMKERVNNQRRKARELARSEVVVAGRTASNAKRGLDITSDHAAMLIAYLRARGIKFVVAPYEADAQLVYLEKQGIIDGIISEDSDLLVFGAQRLLTKADARTGVCAEVCAAKFPPNLSLQCLRIIAIVSGCDYSPGVAGLGPAKAAKLIEVHNCDFESVLLTVTRTGKADFAFTGAARDANSAFLFQRVWDPVKCVLTFLNCPEKFNGAVTPLLGDHVVGAAIPRPIAHKLALGRVDPHNFERSLSVQPHISTYVAKLTPFTLVKPHKLSTPVGATREISRRLPTPSSANSVSNYFKTTPKRPASEAFRPKLVELSNPPQPTAKHLDTPETPTKPLRTTESPLRKRKPFGPTVLKPREPFGPGLPKNLFDKFAFRN